MSEDTAPDPSNEEAGTPENTNGAVEPTPEVATTPEATADTTQDTPEQNSEANEPAHDPVPEDPTGTEAAQGDIPAPSPLGVAVEEAEAFVKTIGDYTSMELHNAKKVILNLISRIKGI